MLHKLLWEHAGKIVDKMFSSQLKFLCAHLSNHQSVQMVAFSASALTTLAAQVNSFFLSEPMAAFASCQYPNLHQHTTKSTCKNYVQLSATKKLKIATTMSMLDEKV